MTVSAARAVLAHKSKSFALAGRFLPRGCRDDAAVLYAYCRHADDAIDESPAAERTARVERLSAELASVYAGERQTEPLLAAFQTLVEKRKIPEEYPRALLDGLRTDIGQVRLATLDELLLYAYRVAGVVGIMMCYVIGGVDRRALRHAVHLGIAMQLTNICRDIAEDWARERLYIPRNLLAVHGAPEAGDDFRHPLAAYAAPLARASAQLLVLADRYYASADAGIPALPGHAAFAVRTARLVYAAIGTELARRGYDVLGGRAIVPGWKKLALLVRAAAAELVARSVIWLRPVQPGLLPAAPPTKVETDGHPLSLEL